MISDKWNLYNIPPKGNVDVAEFAAALFDIARMEKDRLGKTQDFLSNYALYRGTQHRPQTAGRKGGQHNQPLGMTPINLYFSNINRTVANITARIPTGEVVDMDGLHDDAENILSMQLKKWWKDTDQQLLTKDSALGMEINGITVEKPAWDKSNRQPSVDVTDPFAFFPCPGNWSNDELTNVTPYVCYAYLEFVAAMESFYEVKDIGPDEAYDLLGNVREEYKHRGHIKQSIGNYADPMSIVSTKEIADKKIERCLVLEIWVRDNRTKKVKASAAGQGDNGQEITIEAESDVPTYRDGIRKITITKTKDRAIKSGWMVLDDCDNPNINPALPTEIVATTYPWGKLPVYFANSYKDGISMWGFAAAEQVGDLLAQINTIVAKLVNYVKNVMTPPLIVQQHCGITREMIESSISKAGRLILMPSTPNARIEFMQIPSLPTTFFQVLDLLISFFDRVYQIEDADRGVKPTGVIAASAIVALQERNQVLMQTKTAAIDTLVENRSRWAIGLWQNHGVSEETVDVAGVATPFIGVNLAGRKFNFVVEAGSTTPRTSLQRMEQAMELYKMKAIGQRGLLEAINWEGWKEEMERTAESQTDQALQILVDAGLPPEDAIQIKTYVMQSSMQTTKPGAGATALPAAPAGV